MGMQALRPLRSRQAAGRMAALAGALLLLGAYVAPAAGAETSSTGQLSVELRQEPGCRFRVTTRWSGFQNAAKYTVGVGLFWLDGSRAAPGTSQAGLRGRNGSFETVFDLSAALAGQPTRNLYAEASLVVTRTGAEVARAATDAHFVTESC